MPTMFSWFKQQSVFMQSFLAFVVAPTLAATLYYGLFASDIFLSESRFAIRTTSQTLSPNIFDSILTSAGSISEDAMIVRDYIHSHDMLEELDRQLGIRNHYSADSIDIISRFDSDETIEEFLLYYRDKIEIVIDPMTNITTINVRAFNAEMSQKIASAIIEISENLVNRLSERIMEDSLRFARKEVQGSEARVRTANQALTNFRTSMNSINPGEETSAFLRIVMELESRLATARAELIQAENFMQADSPQVLNLSNKVAALETQAKEEKQRLISEEDSAIDYIHLIDTYEPLVLEKELARQFYTSALTSLEVARAEAQLKQRYLLLFVNPKVPDEAVEPDRPRAVLIIFIALCMFYAITGLVWAAIKDHMRL